MMSPPRFVEWLLALPLIPLAGIVFAVWALVATAVHRLLVPRIVGGDARKFGKLEAEVAAQLGIVLGLLLSFNAVTVWEQSGAAREATLSEASALREVHEILPELPPDLRAQVHDTLREYVGYVVDDEWSRLGGGPLSLDKPPSLRSLARLGRASGSDDLHDAVAAAIKARDDRIRVATWRMLPARWTIVIVLGTLTLIAIGLVHAEHRRARAVAIAMVSFAIAACFVVLMIQARPFNGALAVRPTELSALARELANTP